MDPWVALITDTGQRGIYRTVGEVPKGRKVVVAVMRRSVLTKDVEDGSRILYLLDEDDIDPDDDDSMAKRAVQAAKVATALNQYEKATNQTI